MLSEFAAESNGANARSQGMVVTESARIPTREMHARARENAREGESAKMTETVECRTVTRLNSAIYNSGGGS